MSPQRKTAIILALLAGTAMAAVILYNGKPGGRFASPPLPTERH